MKSYKILVVDDEKTIVKVITAELLLQGYEVESVYNGLEASKLINHTEFDLVLLDYRMPKMDGVTLLKRIKEKYPSTVVIMMTAFGTIKNAVEAIKIGAYDYLTKPFENDDMINKVKEALKIKDTLSKFKKESDSSNTQLIGTSKKTNDIKAKINKIQNLNTTVLITGESGTGKGVVAKLIHESSNRSHLPFVNVNCAVLPENLIESELFGHEKGAFTGAIERKKGKFELAGKGTIFLDEIATLNHNLQAKLLTVLQDREIQRIGGDKNIAINARIIAATNENLEYLVRKKEFREDLYYRLNVINIECSPLRYRKEDIMVLVKFFINKFNRKFNKNIKDISDEVKNIFKRYDWPGNIRELENTIESAIALSEGDILGITDLPLRISDKVKNSGIIKENIIKKDELDKNQFSVLEIEELKAIKIALERNKGHRKKTSEELGISRRTLQYKLKKFGLVKQNKET